MISRRRFLQQSSFAAGSLLFLGKARTAFAYEANSRLNVAFIGVGGQGASNITNIASLGENVAALCDVDDAHAGETFSKYPTVRRFKDFRRMFDAAASEIDAVVVSTPDHTHAVAAAAGLRLGKHLYCEKPLTRTVQEARILRQLAREHKVVTQMGNQGSAETGLRRGVELVWAGAIGQVREAHVWVASGNRRQKVPTERPTVPETLAWDLWLGPAPDRAYHPCYLPAAWRGWRAFGSGVVGDFGCHTANLAFRALRLEELWSPSQDAAKPEPRIIRVEAHPSERDQEGYPKSMKATISLPARGQLPGLQMTFYALLTPHEELMLGHRRGAWGDLLVGSKGSLYSDCPWNTRYTLLPRAKFPDGKKDLPETLPRSGGHHREWIEACKGKGATFSSFDVGGPLTELSQLINLATIVEGAIEYEPVSGTIKNHSAAAELLHRPYRTGWRL